MTIITALTDGQREFLSERIYGQKHHAGKHQSVRTGKRARFRNKLGVDEWLYPGPGKNDRNLKRMPKEIEGQQLGDEYGWDYPVCEQWKEGYAFDITTGQGHEEIIDDDFYWNLVLPLTRGGGNLPYFGFTNHQGGARLKSDAKPRKPFLFKKEENKCTHCGSKNMTEDVNRGEIRCEDCGSVAKDVPFDNFAPEGEIISGGQYMGTRFEELAERSIDLKKEIYRVGKIGWMKDIDAERETEIKEKIFEAVTTEKRAVEDFVAERFKELDEQWQERREFRKMMRNREGRIGPEWTNEAKRLANETAKKLEQAMNSTDLSDRFGMPVAAYVYLRQSEDEGEVKNGWTSMTVDVANAIVDGKLEYKKWWEFNKNEYEDIDLEAKTKTMLVNMAKAEGIEDLSSMKKAELIAALTDKGDDWCPVVQGSKDPISEALIEEAQRLIDKGEWGSELRHLFGSFISTNQPLWLEFVSSILICSTAKDSGSGEVTIRNEHLRDLHEGMLGKGSIQDPKRTANLAKVPKKASGYNRPQLSPPLEFEWNYMSILAVVSMVRMYFLFFEDKTVRWN